MNPEEFPSVQEGRDQLTRNIMANPDDLTMAEQQIQDMANARSSMQSPPPLEVAATIRDIDLQRLETQSRGDIRLIGDTVVQAFFNSIPNPRDKNRLESFDYNFWDGWLKSQNIIAAAGDVRSLQTIMKDAFQIRAQVEKSTNRGGNYYNHLMRELHNDIPEAVGRALQAIEEHSTMIKDQQSRKQEVVGPQQGSVKGGPPALRTSEQYLEGISNLLDRMTQRLSVGDTLSVTRSQITQELEFYVYRVMKSARANVQNYDSQWKTHLDTVVAKSSIGKYLKRDYKTANRKDAVKQLLKKFADPRFVSRYKAWAKGSKIIKTLSQFPDQQAFSLQIDKYFTQSGAPTPSALQAPKPRKTKKHKATIQKINSENERYQKEIAE